MSDLILHHYPTSPFAEKIRLILGYKQLAWKSVFIPMIMPKPDLTALTGGYRKTPVLQIGADVYCDTALICDVLEHWAPTPSLYPEAIKGTARIVAQWADSALFTAAMAYNFQPAGVAQVFEGAPLKAFRPLWPTAPPCAAAQHGWRLLTPPALTKAICAAWPTCCTVKTFCWASNLAWPTLRLTTRCGSRKNAPLRWPAFWTRRPKSKHGWSA